jgi:hypothetical protein
MEVLVLGNNIARSRLVKYMPNFSLDRAMQHAAASPQVRETRQAEILVGGDGLYNGGQKIPWSRLGAWQLRRLGIAEVRIALSDAASTEHPADLPDSFVFLQTLTVLATHQEAARELFGFLDRSLPRGEISLLQNPLLKIDDIYLLINGHRITSEFRLEAIKTLKSRGQFFLDKLEPHVWQDVYAILGSRERNFLVTFALQHLKANNFGGEQYIGFLEGTGQACLPDVLPVIEEHELRQKISDSNNF